MFLLYSFIRKRFVTAPGSIPRAAQRVQIEGKTYINCIIMHGMSLSRATRMTTPDITQATSGGLRRGSEDNMGWLGPEEFRNLSWPYDGWFVYQDFKLSDAGREARRLQPRRPAAVRSSAW